MHDERRYEILKALYWRKYEKIKNLAFEFGVSERTIRRDIAILSTKAPIYTQSGRYDGGVYLLSDDANSFLKTYVSDTDVQILDKLLTYVEEHQDMVLDEEEKAVFRRIVTNYKKIKK